MSSCGCSEKISLPPSVLQVINPEVPVLFHKVPVAASLGDDTTIPPSSLNYKNVLIEYKANKHVYLYSSDGAYTLISSGNADITQIEEALKELNQKIDTKQDLLVTGINIKSVNNNDLLGSGNVDVSKPMTVKQFNNLWEIA